MNNKYTVFLILAILVIAFLWNKNEHIDSNVDNIIAKGTITTPGNITGGGLISQKDAVIKGTLSADGLFANYIKSNGGIDAKGTITTPGNITGGGLISNGEAIIKGTLSADGLRANYIKSGGIDTGVINATGIVTAKKFVSTDGSSSGALSNEAIQNIASVYNKDNFAATNITATSGITSNGVINATGNITGGGLISQKDAIIKGSLSADSLSANYIKSNGGIDANGVINANGGFKTPLDMTVHTPGAQVSLWKDAKTKGNNVMCLDGYYMAGIVQHWEDPQAGFFVQCRKLPGA